MTGDSASQPLTVRRRQGFITAPELPVTFVQVPESGSSAVKVALWLAVDAARGTSTYQGDPYLGERPWTKVTAATIGDILAKPAFTVVRCPFRRALSAFADKLMRMRPPALALIERHGPIPDFVAFLEAVRRDPPDVRDRHFAPMSDIVAIAPAARVFRLEAPDELNGYLLETIGQPFPFWRGDYPRLPFPQSYTGRAADLVREIYAEDFERFGYSTDLPETHDRSQGMTFSPHPDFEGSSHPVGDLALCHVRVHGDARFPWLILIPRVEGAREIEDLSAADRARLMEEIVLAGRAVRAMGQAAGFVVTKLNVGALGNVTPQLHVHVIGRNPDDPAGLAPVWGQGAAEPYAADAAETAISAARRALSL